MSEGETWIDTELIPDADADAEMGPGDEAIADEDIRGSRLILVRKAIERIDIKGTPGGAVGFACTFHPAPGSRFIWARLILRLITPEGTSILDLAPREVREKEPVSFKVTASGELGLEYGPANAKIGANREKTYSVYHCSVRGSGEATPIAMWDFEEDPDTQDGLGTDQELALTLPVVGIIGAEVSVSTRIARDGLPGKAAAFRDLILCRKPGVHQYPIEIEVPEAPPVDGIRRFFLLS